MIWLYSGTPGSGKSLHAAKDIYNKLVIKKQSVIATFDVNLDLLTRSGRRRIGKFVYVDIMKLNVKFLIDYAREYHVKGKEAQTLVIIDECQIIFNPREFSRSDRLDWINFFTQHRKFGYNFILISQFDRLLDRQIRCLLEYNVIHRKVNNFGMAFFIPFKVFAAITYWYGVKEKVGFEFFTYRSFYAKFYDTYMIFDDKLSSEGLSAESSALAPPAPPVSPPNVSSNEDYVSDNIDFSQAVLDNKSSDVSSKVRSSKSFFHFFKVFLNKIFPASA